MTIQRLRRSWAERLGLRYQPTAITREYVRRVIESGRVENATGQIVRVSGGISIEEGEWLYELAQQAGADTIVEIGCAHGTSAMYLAQSVADAGGHRHILIDPFESSRYDNIALLNLERLGLRDRVEMIEEPSEVSLPRLAAAGLQIDFAFIDGSHVFDHVLIDCFYIDRMLKPGGIAAFHDCDFPSVARVIGYLRTHRQYVEVRRRWIDPRKAGLKRWLRNLRRLILNLTGGHTPKRRLVSPLRAFKKVADYEPAWDFWRDF